MLALTYRGPNKVRVEKKAEPKLEHPNDVILKVTRTAICGSDLHLLHGLVPDTRVGCVFGHEFAGVVEEVGSSVASLMKGDRIVVPFNISCGTCFFCQRGLIGNCENTNPNAGVASGVYDQLTPVFGTAVPPRGVSGVMRKAGYKIPEHFTSHWLILMAADRVDVLEDRFKFLLPFAIPLAAAGLYLGIRAQRKTWWRALLA